LAAVLGLLSALLGPATPTRADGVALTWPDHPAPASTAASVPCADLLVIGSRGSLEQGPYGSTVQAWRESIAAATADAAGETGGQPERQGTVRELYVDYPALAPDTMLSAGLGPLLFGVDLPATPYLASVADGVANLTTALDDSATRCPSERWVLLGYSQGSQVINEALASRGEARSRQLLSAVLLGNPGHYQGQSVTEPDAGAGAPGTASGLTAAMYYIRQGAAAGRAAGGEDRATADGVRAVLEISQGKADTGVLAAAAAANRLAISPGLEKRVLSLCNAGDMVCDAGPAIYRVVINGGSTDDEISRTAALHAAYQPTDFPVVAEQLATAVRAVVPLATASPSNSPSPLPGGAGSLALIVGGIVVLLAAVGGVAFVVVRLRRPTPNSDDSDGQS